LKAALAFVTTHLRLNRARLGGPLAGWAMVVSLLLLASCHDPTGDPHQLRVFGRVTAEGSGQPIAGATVRVLFIDPNTGAWQPELGSGTTSATGDYLVVVGSPPGYAFPNCAVMGVAVRAEGFLDAEVPLLSHSGCPVDIEEQIRLDVALIGAP
jgi:hypothetical protein